MDTYNTLRITQTARTITSLLDLHPIPDADEPLSCVLESARIRFDGKPADRVFMYNPDAIALWLYQKYTALYTPLMLRTQLTIPLLSVMPSVTPVCFASMYSGLPPEGHGIQSYTKPVLTVDTVFDAIVKSNKRAAIVSQSSASMSMIFLERNIDYFIYDSVEECNKKVMELIEHDEYDLIALYNGNYDSQMHRYAPEGEESISALKDNINTFANISDMIDSKWNGHRTVLAFAPDHGCHEIDGGVGSHGLDMTKDLNILHFYRFC